MTEVEQEPQTEAPEPEPDEEPEPEAPEEPEGRCEAETVTDRAVFRCALQAGHDGEHAFQEYADLDTGELVEEEPAPSVDDVQGKALERAVRNYSAAVVKALGATLEPFTLCPCCHPSTPGLYLQHQYTDEQMAQLRAIVGLPSLENYKRDNRYSPCATCDGLGTVLTGSRVPAHMTGRCVDCNGSGYISHDTGRPTPERAPILDVPGNGGEVVTGEPPPFDPWGRPYGDPDYYRMPIAGVTT